MDDASSRKKSFKLIFWLTAAKLAFILLTIAAGIWVIYLVTHTAQSDKQAVSFGRIYGSGFAPRSDTFSIASSSGLYRYSGGTWQRVSKRETNGKIQFLPVRQGWLEVDPVSNRVIIRNWTGGRIGSYSLANSQKGFWAASYQQAYVVRLTGDSGHYTIDQIAPDGTVKQTLHLRSIQGKAQSIALHPTNNRCLAVATRDGLYVTEDGGVHFKKFFKGKDVTSVAFGFAKQPLIYAALFDKQSKKTALYTVYLSHQNTVNNLDLATVESDRVTQVVTRSNHPHEIIVRTSNNDAYLTNNYGNNWIIIAHNGRGLASK